MRFTPALLAVLSVAAAVPARAQIERPRLGFVLDSLGHLRPVMGDPASATLGDPARDPAGVPAISLACSSKLCLVKTDAEVFAFIPDRPEVTQSVAAPPGPALIAPDNSTAVMRSAWIYFQAAGQLARWHDGILDFTNFVAGGALLALRATAGGFDCAVAREGGAWIEHYSASDGSIAIVDSLDTIDSLGAAVVMLLDDGMLMSSTDSVLLRRPDGQRITFPLAGPKEFHAAGNGYVEIAGPDGLWILRTDPGREELFLLPGAAE
jgi:hypothetical protein